MSPFVTYDQTLNVVTLELPSEFSDKFSMLYVTLSDGNLATTYNMPLRI